MCAPARLAPMTRSNKGLFEGHGGRVDGLPGQEPGDELVKQFGIFGSAALGHDDRTFNSCCLELTVPLVMLCLKHKIKDRLHFA